MQKGARSRKEVIDMDWNKLAPEEKVKWLSQQLEDIRRAQALIERFERVTQKWLKRVQATQKKA
jgi:hypothetical protein